MGRYRFLFRRPVEMIPVLIGISFISFVLLQLTPGDPARLMLGPRASQEAIDAIHLRYGLDRPVAVQYFYYLANLLRGDLGQSLAFRAPVGAIILSKIGPTLYLLIYGLVLSVIMTLALAITAARRQGRAIDQCIRLICVAGVGVPSYFIGLLLVLVFSLKLGWFPASGYGRSLIENLYHLFLPALTIGVAVTPILTRNLRATLIQQMGSDVAVAGLSKGLPAKTVFRRHVLWNSLLPTVSLFGVVASFLIGGTVIIENLFNIPGLGLLLVRGVLTRDYFIVQGVTLVLSFGIVLSNLLIDVAIAALDPRIRM